jgi:hypothetical protein
MKVRNGALGALVSVVTAALVFTAAPTAFASPNVIPMAGETFLTQAERIAAVQTMRPAEFEELGGLFADGTPGLLVAYTRREFNIVTLPDGTRTAEPVGELSDPGSALSLSNTAVAGTGGKPGTDLYISITMVRTRSSSPYEWQIHAYADWSGHQFPAGLDAFNSSEDSIGVAWAGGLYLYQDTKGGLYWPCSDGIRDGLDIYRSDATPNAGVGYSFHEWNRAVCLPHGTAAMDFANTNQYIRETTWKNQTSNSVMKYFHTYGGLSYSLSFSQSPSISISPTSEQWSAAAYTSFSH